jgi:MoaA/NifB/PqqE/SkfB family radical SAM enzyme
MADIVVKRLIAVHADGTARAAWLGDPRPDVASAFPHSASAKSSGYVFLLPTGAPTKGGAWWFETKEGKWGRCIADWRASQILTVESEWIEKAAVPLNILETAEVNVAEERLQLAFAQGAGITLRLDLINKCNLRCIMCHYSQDEVFKRPAQSVTPDQFQQLFEGIASAVGEVVLSCADEPLASKFFPEILSYLRRVRPDVIIRFCTNAMLMSAPLRRIIVEHRVDHVLFSIDGVNRATFEGIRRGAKFSRVLGHIHALRELRDRSGATAPNLTVNFVMMARNIHEAPLFITLARRLGLTCVDFRHVVECFADFDLFHEQLQTQPGRFNYYRELMLQASEREHIALYLPPAFIDAPLWSPGVDEPVATLADVDAALADAPLDARIETLPAPPPKVSVPEPIQRVFEHTFCTRPFSEIVIRNQNEVMPCPWHRTHLGTLSEMPRLSDHFFGPRFQELRQAMLRPEGHANCLGCPLKSQELPSARHDN